MAGTRTHLILAIAMATSATCAARSATPSDTSLQAECLAGAYRVDQTRWIVLHPGDEPDLWRYTFADGEIGTLRRVGGLFRSEPGRPALEVSTSGCSNPEIRVRRSDDVRTFERVRMRSHPLNFRSTGELLYGELVSPESGEPQAIVVWITGSDQTGDIGRTDWQYILPLHGLGVVIFDKRGTGRSKGTPTANFVQRADDAIAAITAARKVSRAGATFGLLAGSQGGWVAPLIAARTKVDFLINAYSMAEPVTAEDRGEIVQNLQESGFGSNDIYEALELQAAAAVVAKSGWKSGWNEYDALRARYADADWMRYLGEDGFTGFMVKRSSAEIREVGPKADLGIMFGFDPLPTIRSLQIPQLWILGGSDRAAPSDRSRQLLGNLQREGRPIDLVVYPSADHGMVEAGRRDGVEYRHNSDRYVDLVVQWATSRTMPELPLAIVDLSDSIERIHRPQ